MVEGYPRAGSTGLPLKAAYHRCSSTLQYPSGQQSSRLDTHRATEMACCPEMQKL